MPNMIDVMEKEGIVIEMATPLEVIEANIKANKTLKVKGLAEISDWRATDKIAVVGGGPSVAHYLKDISIYNMVIAAGTSFDFSIENHIRPNYCVIVDPDPISIKYLNYAGINNDTKFLVASHCDPSIFKHLMDRECTVIKFNIGGPLEYNDKVFGPNQIVVGGGHTVGMRSIIIAMGFGYSNIDLYGMDSCLDNNDRSHAYNFYNPELEKAKKTLDISVGSDTFKVPDYLVAQIYDFKALAEMLRNRVNFRVFGGGPLATILAELEKKVPKNGEKS